jgi:hypothetical protein
MNMQLDPPSMTVRAYAYPFGESYLIAIGEVTHAWNEVEAAVVAGIEGFGSLSEGAIRQKTYRKPMDILLDFLKKHANDKLQDGASKAELYDIGQQIIKLRDDRNDIVHATWQRSESPDTVDRVRYKKQDGEIQVEITEASVQSINDTARSILNISMVLQEFLKRHGALAPP